MGNLICCFCDLFKSKPPNDESSTFIPQSTVAASANRTPLFTTLPYASSFKVPLSQYDWETFFKLLLTLDLSALREDYFETLITEHLRAKGWTTRNTTELPLTYTSLYQYKQCYLPLMFYDAWANIVSDYFEDGEDSKPPLPPLDLQIHSCATNSAGLQLIYLRCIIPRSRTNDRDFTIANWAVLVQVGESSEDPSVIEDPEKTALGFVSEYNRDVNRKKRQGGRNCADNDGMTAIYLISDLSPPRLCTCDDSSSCTCQNEPAVEVQYTVQVNSSAVARMLLLRQKSLIITPISYIRPVIRQVETLLSMNKKEGFNGAFLNPDRAIFAPNFRQPSGGCFHSLGSANEQQRNATFACFNAVSSGNGSDRTVMIQGPPGTGKTHTLVAIVESLLLNTNAFTSTPNRILICTPSNGAIDAIAMRLLKRYGSFLNLIRIGNFEKVHPDVAHCHFDMLVSKALKPHEKFEEERKLLTQANVILSTLNSVQSICMNMFRSSISHDISYTFKKDRFSGPPQPAFRCVIIDEAGQSTEPELLMPLVYPTNKLILIGDHLQLPATVISNLAQGKGFGRSMFERFFHHFETSNLTNPVITLQYQYRMHAEICAFPSLHFYGNQLQTPLGTGENERVPLDPYLVFNVANTKEAKTAKTARASTYNVQEAVFVCRLVAAIFSKLGYEDLGKEKTPQSLDGLTIGIITFYRGQKEELTRRLTTLLGGKQLPDYIDVNTVDAFQGQERNIVILSCVRAFDGSRGTVGFVKSQQRMNVALTRAKSALYVAIKADSFLQAPNWAELLADATKRNRLLWVKSKETKAQLERMISLVD